MSCWRARVDFSQDGWTCYVSLSCYGGPACCGSCWGYITGSEYLTQTEMNEIEQNPPEDLLLGRSAAVIRFDLVSNGWNEDLVWVRQY
jgi:hypothetical protein